MEGGSSDSNVVKFKIKLKAPSSSVTQSQAATNLGFGSNSSIPVVTQQTSSRERKKRAISNSPKQSKKRKTPLSVCLQKLITLIRQKDTYGFFLNPVDPKVVPDYRKIIKDPMDLGTMKEKVAKRAYKSCEEFQADFELIIRNAKTYNSPDTVYYKSAEKLLSFGVKLIEKEIPGVIPDPEVVLDVFYDDIPSVSSAAKVPRAGKVSDAAPIFQPPPPKDDDQKRRQAKKIKHCDDLENLEFEKFNSDGTIYIDPETVTEPPIQRTSPIVQFAASYPRPCLNGIFPQDLAAPNWHGADAPTTFLTFAETEVVFLTYGDLRGKAYLDSIERFTQGLDIEGLGLSEKISKMTRDSQTIAKKTKAALAEEGASSGAHLQAGSIEYECGSVDILKQIEYCRGEAGRLLEKEEAEALRALAAENAHCLLPENGQDSNEPEIQVSPLLFEQVRSDLANLFNNPNDLKRDATLDLIRRRLLALAVYSRDPELNLKKEPK